MKHLVLIVLLIALCLSIGPAAAEGSLPADKKLYTTDDVISVPTLFRLPDKAYYEVPCEHPGTVVRLDYTTTQYGDERQNYVNVYLPYGYDENADTHYPVMYFFHGTNETQESFITDDRAKNTLDHMIEYGVAPAYIMVFPTYYYDYETRTLSVDGFAAELREDIMPLVESTYRTYAETTDQQGLNASRAMRAISGYSRGGRMTWQMFTRLQDIAYWFLPMSGAYTNPEDNPVEEDMVANLLNDLEAAAFTEPSYVYASCGGKRDLAFDGVTTVVSGLMETSGFSYGTDASVNNLYYCLSNEIHQTLIGRYYLYNAFCDVLWK